MTQLLRLSAVMALILIFLIGPAGLSLAQIPGHNSAQASSQPLTLLADEMSFDPKTRRLRARGHVEVYQGEMMLKAPVLIFDDVSGALQFPQGFEMIDGDQTYISAREARLQDDLEAGLARDIRVLVNDQFQLAAATLERQSGRYDILENAIGSSCKICAQSETPLWQIKAARIIHDKETKRLYFEKARLEIFGVPVLYAPRLRVPAPGVRRASGFLPARFISSTTLGYGIKQPYFFALGDHRDATVTPYLVGNSFLLEMQYRQNFETGWLQAEAVGLLKDGVYGESGRSALTLDGGFDLPRGFELSFGVDVASDKAFLSQFGYGSKDRLTSFLRLSHAEPQRYFSVETSRIQSLRSFEVDDEIPTIFPQLRFSRYWQDPLLNGTFRIDLSSVTLLRAGGRSFARIDADAGWSGQWISRNGVVAEAELGLRHQSYGFQEDPLYGSKTEARRQAWAALDLSWPLAKITPRGRHLITPMMQLSYAGGGDDALVPNEESVTAEFEETNLFALSHFIGSDRYEAGARLGLGVSYAYHDASSWALRGTIGQLFWREPRANAPRNSGMSAGRQKSDMLLAVQFEDARGIYFHNRMMLTPELELNKAETLVDLTRERWSLEMSHLWLREDLVDGVVGQRNEGVFGAFYQATPNWAIEGGWAHDFERGSSARGNFGVVYENECVRVNLSLSIDYAQSDTLSPTRELGLSVQLAGLGDAQNRRALARQCQM